MTDTGAAKQAGIQLRLLRALEEVLAQTRKEAERKAGPKELSENELYCIYRDYLKHEDDLINNRLNWNFTIQGFLFAAYSFSIEKVADIRMGLLSTAIDGRRIGDVQILHSVQELHVLLAAIAFVGIGVSLFVYISVQAARIAIHELEARWATVYPDYRSADDKIELSLQPGTPRKRSFATEFKKAWRDDQSIKTHGANPPGLPGLVGGGHPMANLLGFHAPNWLPLLFIGVWLFLLVDVVVDLY